jgi:hypothetical protein
VPEYPFPPPATPFCEITPLSLDMLTKSSSWDDVAFLDTSKEPFRGGIWKKEAVAAKPVHIPDEDAEDDAEGSGDGTDHSLEALKIKEARTMSTPALASSQNAVRPRGAKKDSIQSLADIGLSSGFDRTIKPDPPRGMRSTSFAAAAGPTATADTADGDHVRSDRDPLGKHDEASAILKDLSSKSATASPSGSPSGSPRRESSISLASNDHSTGISANASSESLHANPLPQRASVASIQSLNQSSGPDTPTSAHLDSQPAHQEEPKHPKTLASAARSLTSTDRKQALASINAATAAAQRWGWGVINRNKQREAEAANKERTPETPMGRGRPLPPPGIPLPPPERSPMKTNPFTVPKRRPVPPPQLPKRPDTTTNEQTSDTSYLSPKPPLPERRNRQSSFQEDNEHRDDVLVVQAPVESAPTSPVVDEHQDDFLGHGEPESRSGATEDLANQEVERAPALSTESATNENHVGTSEQ